jgi:hypothetical protein
MDGNPGDERVEQYPNFAQCVIPKAAVPVNMLFTVDGIDLFNLPARGEGHQAVGFRDI